MIQLFKYKQTRPLGFLLLFILLYLILCFLDGGFLIFTGATKIHAIINALGIFLNVYTIIYCSLSWSKSHKNSIHREIEHRKEMSELQKIAPSLSFKLVDYKQQRKQMAWLWSLAILANLLSLSTHWW